MGSLGSRGCLVGWSGHVDNFNLSFESLQIFGGRSGLGSAKAGRRRKHAISTRTTFSLLAGTASGERRGRCSSQLLWRKGTRAATRNEARGRRGAKLSSNGRKRNLRTSKRLALPRTPNTDVRTEVRESLRKEGDADTLLDTWKPAATANEAGTGIGVTERRRSST